MSAITESEMSKFKIKRSKIIEIPFWVWLIILGFIGYSTGHFLRDLIRYFFGE